MTPGLCRGCGRVEVDSRDPDARALQLAPDGRAAQGARDRLIARGLLQREQGAGGVSGRFPLPIDGVARLMVRPFPA